MGVPFTPSPDVTVLLNALLDILERRRARTPTLLKLHQDHVNEVEETGYAARSVKITLADIPLPHYFHTNPEYNPGNEQLIHLEKMVASTLDSGETGHCYTIHSLPKRSIGSYETFHFLACPTVTTVPASNLLIMTIPLSG
jgi:hypothetical protein